MPKVSITYPKPGPTGGVLIREVIAFTRELGLVLPLSSHIHIAVSGGADSLAMAHLLITYGRRVVPRNRIHILHINHGWRGKESDEDSRWVQKLAKSWGVHFRSVKLPHSAHLMKGESWENQARRQRKRIFIKVTKGKTDLVFTAHHADDLAETLLWRLFTGAIETHKGGILTREGPEVRPLLRVRKQDLRKYLTEEGVQWREDSTNFEGRFLRSKMRLKLMSLIEELFPRAIEHLGDLALSAQKKRGKASSQPSLRFSETEDLLITFLISVGVRLRRAHWKGLLKQAAKKDWAGELHFPGGWRLIKK